MNDRIGLFVSSCDKFHDAWMPFFTLLNKYWPEYVGPKYLSTESEVANIEGVTTLTDNSSSWSERLINNLKKIDQEFIFFCLEDFFLMSKVNNEKLNSILEMMEVDPLIAVVYPKQISTYSNRDEIHPEYIRMDTIKTNKYLVNCQFGLWRRQALLDILKPGLSPWDIERTFRIEEDCKYRFYCMDCGDKFSCQGDVFPYLFTIQCGYGIAQSKWLWNNRSFFRKEGISVNFNNLGTLTYPQYICGKVKNKIIRWLQRKYYLRS